MKKTQRLHRLKGVYSGRKSPLQNVLHFVCFSYFFACRATRVGNIFLDIITMVPFLQKQTETKRTHARQYGVYGSAFLWTLERIQVRSVFWMCFGSRSTHPHGSKQTTRTSGKCILFATCFMRQIAGPKGEVKCKAMLSSVFKWVTKKYPSVRK